MSTKEYPFIIDGNLVEYSQANIRLNSVAFKYAASVFEGLRGYWRPHQNSMAIFALDQHIERLFQSIKLMRMECAIVPEVVRDWILTLIKVNNFREDIYIRCACSISGTGGISTRGPTVISIHAFPQGRKIKEGKGIDICISSWQRIPDIAMPARIKCIANYQNGRLAALQAEEDGYDNVLLLNSKGKVSEAPTACVFFVKKNTLFTPPKHSDILESITRDFIILLAQTQGLFVQERDVDRSEVYNCDEAFLCGTGCEIMPVNSIDRYSLLNTGEKIVPSLQKLFFDEMYGITENHGGWINVQSS